MNKRERKNKLQFSNFGFSTILLAFVMICIVTIAALSLLTANSDYNLSKKVAEKNTAYYQAEKYAYESLTEIDQLLAKAYATTSNAGGYYAAVKNSLTSLPNGTYEQATTTYYYSIPIAENQALEIKLSICYPETSHDNFYEIVTWKSVYSEMEFDEGTLDLID